MDRKTAADILNQSALPVGRQERTYRGVTLGSGLLWGRGYFGVGVTLGSGRGYFGVIGVTLGSSGLLWGQTLFTVFEAIHRSAPGLPFLT